MRYLSLIILLLAAAPPVVADPSDELSKGSAYHTISLRPAAKLANDTTSHPFDFELKLGIEDVAGWARGHLWGSYERQIGEYYTAWSAENSYRFRYLDAGWHITKKDDRGYYAHRIWFTGVIFNERATVGFTRQWFDPWLSNPAWMARMTLRPQEVEWRWIHMMISGELETSASREKSRASVLLKWVSEPFGEDDRYTIAPFYRASRINTGTRVISTFQFKVEMRAKL